MGRDEVEPHIEFTDPVYNVLGVDLMYFGKLLVFFKHSFQGFENSLLYLWKFWLFLLNIMWYFSLI
jgi:hypothetical protein